MTADFQWHRPFDLDVEFGYLDKSTAAPKRDNPHLILNSSGESVLRAVREELKRSSSFTFSVAFVSPRAIALLKQELSDFDGTGQIITSDYLNFNSPRAFAELHNLRQLGIDVRIHQSPAFHPKGYIFGRDGATTAIVGSSNLTESALVSNHEWNLRVTAASRSDLAAQLELLVEQQRSESTPLTQEWIDAYASDYLAPAPPQRGRGRSGPSNGPEPPAGGGSAIVANQMQRDALLAIDLVRSSGERRAIVISATGTGKTILSALDVRAVSPRRLLFVAHREQILDRTIQEYRMVLGGDPRDFGKLTGTVKQPNRRHLFATVQSLSQPGALEQFQADEFTYVVLDEAHRAGAPSYRKIIDTLTPAFLLGMTATPERTDGFNVFELFDYNVPYEIRLHHALEEGMVSPFHYYGIADVTYEDESAPDDSVALSVLVTPVRIRHLISALETYGQAGLDPRGLIFCSRKDEAKALSDELNRHELRGRTLRTIALTGDDSVDFRNRVIEEFENGKLDYILTVDIFNEGVDIPTINQIVMLRKTESAIVFVQQLGRGLRTAPDKDYLVVIDFIGNHANNYLIPIALFGDESLNKESLRQKLISAEESGVLPGLSSVRFDQIAQERVLRSIAETTLDSMVSLKKAIVSMKNRVGHAPSLWDFLRFESVDPVLLATKREHYPALLAATLREPSGLSTFESKALELLSHEVLAAKRLHELVLLEHLLARGSLAATEVSAIFADEGLSSSATHVNSAVQSFTLETHSDVDKARYGTGVASADGSMGLKLRDELGAAYQGSPSFSAAVNDLLATGQKLVAERYRSDQVFTPGRQYSRKDVTRLLGMPRKWASTLYGYKVDRETATCPVFVTLHKSDDIAASTAYEDELVDRSTLRWFTRSRRTLESAEVRSIVDGDVTIYVFVKKDDAEGSGFYFLGTATAHDGVQASMPGDEGKQLDVVRMDLRFSEPIDAALYDYFHPVVTV